MNPISLHLKKPEDFQRSKIDFPFQAICLVLEKEFGKKVWALPHQKGNTNEVLKSAWFAYEKINDKTKKNFKYFMGIIKHLKPKVGGII